MTIIPNWAYKPAKKFQGSLQPTHYGGNYGYQEQVVKAWELPTPEKMSKKELKQFRRFTRYLKTVVDSKQLTKIAALRLLVSKYRLSLYEAKQLID